MVYSNIYDCCLWDLCFLVCVMSHVDSCSCYYILFNYLFLFLHILNFMRRSLCPGCAAVVKSLVLQSSSIGDQILTQSWKDIQHKNCQISKITWMQISSLWWPRNGEQPEGSILPEEVSWGFKSHLEKCSGWQTTTSNKLYFSHF